VDLLGEQGGRVVVDAAATLLDDDLALGQHHGVADLQVLHAIGLELHDERQAVDGDGLVIGGVVLAGEGVVAAAILRHQPRELTGRHVRGAAEHEMLQEMRDARLAARSHSAPPPTLVPHHLSDGRGAVIGGNDDDLQPVLQGEALGARNAASRRPAPRCPASRLLRGGRRQRRGGEGKRGR